MKNEIQVCPLCEEGSLTGFLYSETIGIRGKATEIHGLHASRCDVCGEVSTSVHQLKQNSKLFAAARAEAVGNAQREKGLLVAEQVKKVRELLGLTQLEASRVFGGGDNIFSKYERGEVKQTQMMDRLLRLTLEVPDAAQWLVRYAGLQEKKREGFAGHLPTIKLVAWHDVGVFHHAMHQVTCGPAPVLEEELFNSTNWTDTPLENCVGWR